MVGLPLRLLTSSNTIMEVEHRSHQLVLDCFFFGNPIELKKSPSIYIKIVSESPENRANKNKKWTRTVINFNIWDQEQFCSVFNLCRRPHLKHPPSIEKIEPDREKKLARHHRCRPSHKIGTCLIVPCSNSESLRILTSVPGGNASLSDNLPPRRSKGWRSPS